jgi:hypothetical protein
MEEIMTIGKQPSLIKSKFKAAGIHLGISSVIFLILAYFIIFKWYPFPYFTADGGWQGIRIVALIDLVLGPFLTLVIFNQNKSRREIRFDLSAIAIVQISVLIWGIYTVHIERPAAVVHWEGEFYTMPAKSFKEQGISLKELNQFSAENPPLIHAHRSTDIETLHEIIRLSTEEKLAPFEQFHLYRSFEENKDEAFLYQINIEKIISSNKKMKNELEFFLAKSEGKKDDYIYMPLNARYHNVILIFSKDGDVLGSLDAPYKDQSGQ